MKILVFGSLNLDHTYDVDHFVRPGETLSAVSQRLSAGGKGLNQSIALARAGARVYHAGCLGRGGEMLKDLLDENGVDTGLIRPVDELQGNAVIQLAPSGENCILLFGGSNQCVDGEQIKKSLEGFGPGDWLLLQNEINMLREIVDAAYEKGMNIALNPSPYNEKIASVDLAKIRWLFVNQVEGRQILEEAGGSADKEQLDPADIWKGIHEKYPGLSLLVTLGADGSEAWSPVEGEIRHCRCRAVKVDALDTTGAGDSYTGYFLAGLMEGLSLKECMERASMAAAISVTRPGAAASIPELREVELALGARKL